MYALSAPQPESCLHPLAHVRAARGWSQQRLADLLQRLASERRINLATGQNRVWRWEHYGTVPDEQTQLLLAELLCVPSDLVTTRRWPHWLPAWEDVRFVFPWSTDGTLQALVDASGSVRADGRRFVGMSGLRLAALAHDWQLTPAERLKAAFQGRQVDAELVRWVDERTQHLRRLDDSLGGGALGLLVEEELRLVTGLLRRGSYTAEVGRRLFTVAAELAQLAGWVAFDAGAQGAAQRYYITGLHAAHTAGERALGAYVLACMSYQLAHLGCTRDAVKLALSAREGSGAAASRVVTTLLQLRLAYAHAIAGEHDACTRATEAAMEAQSEVRTAPAGTPDNDASRWLYWLSPAHVDALRGRCLAAAGQATHATTLLRPAIDREVATFTRDGIVHLTWLADAYLSRNDLEPACDAVRQAWALTENVTSERSTELVRAFGRKLSPYNGDPAVRELLPLLTSGTKPLPHPVARPYASGRSVS